ncbi:MAG TPA: hypothetical protein VF846_01145 [Thermoanaerobaculia bacterium]|jgi:hypothetical protein
MTERTPDPVDRDGAYEPASPGMPRWVPILIGGLLVALASLAVFTGLRYREAAAVAERDRKDVVQLEPLAPPGEPGAGASRVMHGNDGAATPVANAPVSGDARAVISGGPGGVQSTVRIWARRGMILQIKPADAMVYVNGMLIGEANQFDTTDEIYDFAEAGSYTVRIVTPAGAEKTYIVTAADDAKQDVATIAAEL